MNPEIKNCQNCKKDFTIEVDDFSFYAKIKVPPPTWCPECSFVRRMVFRNQNSLYKRSNNAPDSNGKLLSIFSEDKNIKVFDRDYWWSDNWDPYTYGRDYDFSRPFFSQMKDLINEVPWPALANWNAVNSEYCNYTTDNKNCYLVFGGDFNEDCSYGTFNMHSRNSQDLYLVEKCDLCFECTDCQDCYKISYGQFSKNCSDCMFVYDCVNCSNCIGCVNLRNKSYCILNEQYTKEEYDKFILTLKLNTRSGIKDFQKIFSEFKLNFPHKFAHILRSVNCTGDNITNGKNCINCFDLVAGSEDLKDVFLSGGNLKDSRNMSHAGHGSELLYDSFGVFGGCRNVKFSILLSASIDVSYSYNSSSCSNIFGCVGIRNGNYCILNKRYTKEEYNEILPKIIEHMNNMPYIDSNGVQYKYGEFFPSDLSTFAYNETIAYDFFPLNKEDAENRGFKWKDKEDKKYNIDLKLEDIPESINEVDDSILNKIIECSHKDKCFGHQCSTAFRIIPQEFLLYKRLGLALPDLCPNCRHYTRLNSRNPMKLWHRSCMCDKTNHEHTGNCTNEFETSYSPDRPETIYCEKCYQQEVI